MSPSVKKGFTQGVIGGLVVFVALIAYQFKSSDLLVFLGGAVYMASATGVSRHFGWSNDREDDPLTRTIITLMLGGLIVTIGCLFLRPVFQPIVWPASGLFLVYGFAGVGFGGLFVIIATYKPAETRSKWWGKG